MGIWTYFDDVFTAADRAIIYITSKMILWYFNIFNVMTFAQTQAEMNISIL